jgi:CRP/FNR family transcriptional regulator, cyclic AMP receptor protein
MPDQNAIWHLENLDVNSMLCPHKRASAELANLHAEQLIPKGTHIYIPKDQAQHLYIIQSGRVKLYTANQEGKEVTLALLGSGEVFGELILAGENTRNDYAIALDDTILCIIKEQDLQKLMREYSGIQLFFYKIFARRQHLMSQRLSSMVFKDSRSRILEYLVQMVAEKGTRVGYEWLIRTNITHQEMSSLTATSRQTVTTTLNELRTRNLITFNRSRILIRDLEAIKKEIKE